MGCIRWVCANNASFKSVVDNNNAQFCTKFQMIESNGGKVTYISISATIGSFVWEIQEGARL